MNIGIPVPFSVQGSNVEEETKSLDEYMMGCNNPLFGKGLELNDGTNVFEYTREDSFRAKEWNAQDESAGVYKVGDILWKACGLVKVSDAKDNPNPRPKNPEEYAGHDTNLDHTTWKHRYFKIPSSVKSGWLQSQWRINNRWYYMFFEARGYGGCGDGGWRWSAKDITSTGTRHHTHYLRTCLKLTYSTAFEIGKDIEAKIISWHGRNSTNIEPTIQFKSVIERGGFFYFRTNVNIPIEYNDAKVYKYEKIVTPSDVAGFRIKRLIAHLNPFDGKNYTETVVQPKALGGFAEWTLLATGEFDCIAFGHVVGEFINVKFLDPNSGAVLDEVLGFPIDNDLDLAKPNREFYATLGIYSKKVMPSETVIKVEIHGEEVKIGEILALDMLKAGNTKASFKNKVRDFSPKEQDKWGNKTYIDGIRVNVHSGVVDFEMVRYDQINRMSLLLSGNKVFVDGSDATDNAHPNGSTIFEATQMIGRFILFDLESSVENKHIGSTARFNFVLEEIV